MSLLPFLVVAFGTGAASLLARRRPDISAAIGVAGLLAGVVAASTIRAADPLVVGGVALAGSDWTRLFVLLGCLCGLLLVIVAAASAWSPHLPGATLCTLGAAAVALGTNGAEAAVAAATAGGVAAALVALPAAGLVRGLAVAARELRAIVVAGVLALVAVAVVAGATRTGAADGPTAALDAPALAGLGLAYLAVAAAAAIRLGVIPFHLRAARVADVAPDVALPLVMAWAPAAFAAVVLAWADGALVPLGAGWSLERSVVLVLAAASIALGTAAALVHDDLEHVVAYTIVADAGVVLLALVALDPGAGQPGRIWLVVFVVVRTAFAGWAAATRMAFGTGRVSELAGWARRAPLLAVALAGLGLPGVGWPGSASFDSRAALVGLSVSGPLANVLLVAGLASAAVYARLFVAGVRQPGAAVRSGPRPGLVPPRRRATGHMTAADAREAWDLNRAPIAAGAVLVLAAIAIAVAGGGVGLRDAAGGAAGARGAAAGAISPP